MSAEEIQVPGVTDISEPQENQPAEPQAEPSPQPETVPYKWRDEERQITAANLDAVANELGMSRDAVLMQLQQGRDYSHWASQNKREMQALARQRAEFEAERNAYLQQLEAQRQQQQPQYGQQQRGGLPQTDDPMELIRWQGQQMLAIQQQQQQFMEQMRQEQEFYKHQAQEKYQADQLAQEDAAFERVTAEFRKKYPGLLLPSREEIVEEGNALGVAQNPNLPYDRAYMIALRSLLGDQITQHEVRAALERQRSPKATVTLPGSGSAPPQPPQPGKSDIQQAVENMTFAQAREFLPEAR